MEWIHFPRIRTFVEKRFHGHLHLQTSHTHTIHTHAHSIISIAHTAHKTLPDAMNRIVWGLDGQHWKNSRRIIIRIIRVVPPRLMTKKKN